MNDSGQRQMTEEQRRGMEKRRLMQDIERRVLSLKGTTANDAVTWLVKNIRDRAENQRRDFGGAFGVANKLCEISKDFLKALKNGEDWKLKEYSDIFEELWSILKSLDLPIDVGWQHDSSSGAEVVEAEAVRAFYPLVFGDPSLDTETIRAECRKILPRLWTMLGDPGCDEGLAGLLEQEDAMHALKADVDAGLADPEQLKGFERKHLITMTYQAWLDGIADVPGELSKFATDKLNDAEINKNGELSLGERKDLLRRLIVVSEEICNFLNEFETCYAQVINNTRRRFQDFKFAKLARVKGLLNARKEAFSNLLNFEAVMREMKKM